MICVIKLTDNKYRVSLNDNVNFELEQKDAEDLRDILNCVVIRRENDETRSNGND